MGAWIALIYPDALSQILGESHNSYETEDENKVKEVKKLFSPLIYSTFILMFVLLIGIFAPVFKQIPLLMNNRDLMRGISYVFLGILTLCQLWTVLLTLIPADFVKQNLDYLHEKQKVRRRLLSGTRTKSNK
jgi:type II secretory pathway component PulF